MTDSSSLEKRVNELASEKPQLELIIRLASRISAAFGLHNIIVAVLKAISEATGCGSVGLYYSVDGEIRHADALGNERRFDFIADDLVKKAFESRQPVKQGHPDNHALMLPPTNPHTNVWLVPLLAGNEWVGEIKMEGLPPVNLDFFQPLLPLFNHAALVLKHAIGEAAQLKKANDQLEQAEAARKKAEEALRKLTQAVKQIPASIVITNLAGDIEYVNPKFTEVSGYTPEEIIGQNVSVYKSGKMPEETYQQLWATILSGQEWHGELLNRKKNGKFYWEQVSLSAIVGESGEMVNILAVKEDITAHKQTENKLRESEEKFRLMTTSARDAIIMLDQEGKVSFWNPAAEDMLGYTEAEVLNRELHLWLVPERFHEAYQKGFEHFKHTGEGAAIGRTLELVAIKKDRTEIPVELSVSSVRLHGQWHALGILRNISERKLAEVKLKYEQDLLRTMMDYSDDCIYFKDRDSLFVRCSTRMARFFQVPSPEDLVGKWDGNFFSEEHARLAYQDEQTIIRTGQPIRGKIEKETWPDGHVTWALTSKMPLYNSTGEIIGTFGISKDLTAIKEAEAKLNNLHRQLMDAARQAGMAEVATSVLHNVGNVLNSVNVSSSLIAEQISQSKISSLSKVVALLQQHANNLPDYLANDAKGKQLPAYLVNLAACLKQEQETVLNEVKMLAENILHIKEIIAMQQNNAQSLGLVETLSAVDLLEDALRLNLGALDRHGIKLVREYAAVPPVAVEKHKVLQILVNLISNAKYACDESGRTDKQITLRIDSRDGGVNISVEDNGVGIAPEHLTCIFNHGFTTRKGGHGYGLHSAALVAAELGGTLQVFSEGPGKGAIFTLGLPFNPAKTIL
jgi:PAS domain S-box-containing protein